MLVLRHGLSIELSTCYSSGELGIFGFLSDAVLGVSNYTVASSESLCVQMPHSKHFQNDILMILKNGDVELEAHITFIDGVFWWYRLELLNGSLETDEHAFVYYLNKGYQIMNKYMKYYNLTHVSNFVYMISLALYTNKLTVENDDALLKIWFDANGSTPMQHAHFHWFSKINGQFVDPGLSVYFSLSKNGLLTELIDNMRIFRLGTTNISISEQQAIEIARPYIDAYAQKHRQQVKKINVSLDFVGDFDGARGGDEFTLFPLWTVIATYDRLNEESVDGYGVLIWADNGEIHSHVPSGWFIRPTPKSNPWPALAVLVIVLPAVFSLNLYVQHSIELKRRIYQ
jgi:hypothetical protein